MGPYYGMVLSAVDECLMGQYRARLEAEGCSEDQEDASNCEYKALFEYRDLLDAPTPVEQAGLMCGSKRAKGCYTTKPLQIRVDVQLIHEQNPDPWARLITTIQVIIHERLHHTGWTHPEYEHNDIDEPDAETSTSGPVYAIIGELFRDSSFIDECSGF